MRQLKELNDLDLEKINGGLASDEYEDLVIGQQLYLVVDGTRVARVEYIGGFYNPGPFRQMRIRIEIKEILIGDHKELRYSDGDYSSLYYIGSQALAPRGDLEKI